MLETKLAINRRIFITFTVILDLLYLVYLKGYKKTLAPQS